MQQLKKTRREPSPPAPQQRAAQIYITNKNVITFWLLLLTQLFYALMYGLFINVNEVQISIAEDFVYTAFMFVLVIAGFGLALAQGYEMAWSGLGFNFVITALSVQTYFLVHAFWAKVSVYFYGSTFDTSTFKIYLTPNQLTTIQNHATLNQAIKCSLSCIVAFSFIMGRAGLLELYSLTVFGTTVYELTRQICLNVFPYDVGTIKIFVFGGVLGSVVSLIIRKLGKQANTIDHFNNYTNRPTIILSLVGTLLCWVLFPLLTRQTTISENEATTTGRVFSIVLAMSSSGLLAIFLGSARYGFRMVTYSVIGAGVATLGSSAYISNPVYAVVFGLSSALAQLVFLAVNTKLKQLIGPMDPHAYVFIGHGFLGIFYETINRQIVQNNPNSLVFDWLKSKNSEFVLGTGAITIGIALILGFFIGTLFACCAYHEEIDHFTDYTYWEKGDGISYSVEEQQKETPVEQARLYVAEHNEPIKERNAYL